MKNFILILFFFSLSSKAEIVESVVALVGNQIIYKTQLDSYMKNLRKKNFKELIFMNQKKYQKVKNSKKTALNYLIDLNLIDLQSKKASLKIPANQINAEIREVLKRNKQSLKSFKKSLKRSSLSFKDFKKSLELNLKRDLIIRKEIDGQIKVNDEEIFGRLGKRSFAKKLSLSYVSFPTKKKAMKAYSQIQKTKGLFSKMKKKNGGSLGVFSEEDMSHNLKKAVLNTKEFEVSPKPLLMNSQYYLLRVDKLRKTLRTSYKKSYFKIKNKLREKRRYQLLSEWVEKLRKKHFIKINQI